MSRPKAWRRYKNYTKAKRKKEIDLNVSFYNLEQYNNPFYPYYLQLGMYDNLHQYSKNKIHCSCSMCSAKTRNKGHRRKRKNYAPAINYGRMDKRRQDAMTADEKFFEKENKMIYVRFFISNGYSGCDYIEDYSFDDDTTEERIDEICAELCYENAESYEYIARGGWDEEWEDPEDEEMYYNEAYAYSSWSYITEEEFEGEQNVY